MKNEKRARKRPAIPRPRRVSLDLTEIEAEAVLSLFDYCLSAPKHSDSVKMVGSTIGVRALRRAEKKLSKADEQ